MKNAAYVMIFNLITQLLGFGLNILMAQNIGVTLEMDTFRLAQAYSFAVSIPIFAAIQVTFIPLYLNIFRNQGEEKADKLYHQLSKILIYLLFAVGALFLGFAFFSSRFVWPGNSGAQQTFLVLTFIMYIGQIFYTYSVLSMVFLQAKEKFFVQSLSVVFINLVPILYFMFFYGKATNVIIVMTLLTFGYIMQFLLVRIYSRRFVTTAKKFSDLQIRKILEDHRIKEFIILAIPVLLSNVILKISDLTEQNAAVLVGVGQLSLLSFSYLLYAAVIGLTITPFITVIYPKIVNFIDKKNHLKKEHYVNIIFVILTITTPILIGFMMFGETVLSTFLKIQYTTADIKMTYLLVSLYLIGLSFFGIRELTYRICYTVGHTKLVMKNTFYAAIIRIIAIILLGMIFKLPGIVLALAASVIMSLVKLRKIMKTIIIGQYNKRLFLKQIGELLAINGLAFISAVISQKALMIIIKDDFIITIISGIVFIGVYGIVLVFSKSKLFKNIVYYMSI